MSPLIKSNILPSGGFAFCLIRLCVCDVHRVPRTFPFDKTKRVAYYRRTSNHTHGYTSRFLLSPANSDVRFVFQLPHDSRTIVILNIARISIKYKYVPKISFYKNRLLPTLSSQNSFYLFHLTN